MISQDLFETFLDSTTSLVLITSPVDDVIYISPALCKIFGRAKDEIMGKAWEKSGLPDKIIDLIDVNLRIAKDQMQSNRVEMSPDYLDGGLTYECNMMPIIAPSGELVGIQTTFEDITYKEDLRRVNTYIDSILEKLQKSNDVDKVIPQVLGDITAAFDLHIATLLFRQDEHWYAKYSYGAGEFSKDTIYLEEQPSLARMIQKRKEVFILNDSMDEGSHFVKSMASKWGIHFLIAIPLHIQGEIFAILTLASRTPVPRFAKYMEENLKRVAGFLSLAFSEDRYIWSREGETTPSKQYLDQMNVGAAILDGKDGTILWSNDVYNAVIPTKFRGINITQMPYYYLSPDLKDIPPEDIFATVVKSGDQNSYGCIQERNKKGVLRYWQVSFVPILQKGTPSRVLCLITDITEWEKTNKKNARLIYAIQEEQYRVRTLLDSVPVGVYISDAEGNILEISQMGQKIWGDRPLPRHIEEYWEYKGSWPQTGKRLQVDDWPIAKAVRRGETTIGTIIDYINFEGKIGTIINSAAPIKNRHGVVIGAVEIDQDITELKTLERNLEATKAYLEAIINQMPVGVAIGEAPTGKITTCNNELRKMFPASMEIPTSIDEYTNFNMLDGEDMKPLSAEEYPLAIALRENRTVNNFQTTIRKSNGSSITVLSSASPVRGKDGQVQGAVTILTDITHQKEIEQRLEKRTQNLIKFNSDMQRFAYVTSNELRESLKSITNYLVLIDKNSS